jgi:hypothetical protein
LVCFKGNTASATSYLRKYEEDMGILGMTFQKFQVFVPSFKEEYPSLSKAKYAVKISVILYFFREA